MKTIIVIGAEPSGRDAILLAAIKDKFEANFVFVTPNEIKEHGLAFYGAEPEYAYKHDLLLAEMGEKIHNNIILVAAGQGSTTSTTNGEISTSITNAEIDYLPLVTFKITPVPICELIPFDKKKAGKEMRREWRKKERYLNNRKWK